MEKVRHARIQEAHPHDGSDLTADSRIAQAETSPESTAPRPAPAPQGPLVEVPLPAPNQTINLDPEPAGTVRFAFNADAATVVSEGNDLVLQINGGEIVIRGYFTERAQGDLPTFIDLPGTEVDLADLLVQPPAGGPQAGTPPPMVANEGHSFAPGPTPVFPPGLMPAGPLGATQLGYGTLCGGGQRVNVLVTGGAGYVGSHVVHALRQVGTGTVVLDNLSTGDARLVPEGIPLIVGDVCDEQLLTHLFAKHALSAVIHLAAQVSVEESTRDPLRHYAENTVAIFALLRACVTAKIRFLLFSSTAAVYGQPDRLHVTEDTDPRPISAYGASKQMAERMIVDAARAYQLSYTILRFFNVAGAELGYAPRQAAIKPSHLVRVACRAALADQPDIVVFGNDYPTPDGTCIRGSVHVADVAGGASTAVNVGYGRGASVLEVLDAVERVSGRRLRRRAAPTARVVPPRWWRRTSGWFESWAGCPGAAHWTA
jgi:UDP-glucose 4-epimerase